MPARADIKDFEQREWRRFSGEDTPRIWKFALGGFSRVWGLVGPGASSFTSCATLDKSLNVLHALLLHLESETLHPQLTSLWGTRPKPNNPAALEALVHGQNTPSFTQVPGPSALCKMPQCLGGQICVLMLASSLISPWASSFTFLSLSFLIRPNCTYVKG